jgi:hypothetical protein
MGAIAPESEGGAADHSLSRAAETGACRARAVLPLRRLGGDCAAAWEGGRNGGEKRVISLRSATEQIS